MLSNENQDQLEKETEKEYRNIKNQYQEIQKQPEEKRLSIYQTQLENEEVIGELSIENTNLNVPIVQGKDNQYYLNHLVNRKENALGSIFMDYRNQKEDKKILIYGHNSRQIETDFHLLESYLDETFFNNHRNIQLTWNEEKRNFQVIMAVIEKEDTSYMNIRLTEKAQEDEWNRWLEKASQKEPLSWNKDSCILILQTCYYEPKDSYLLVIARELE